jgi:hypothetical protein
MLVTIEPEIRVICPSQNLRFMVHCLHRSLAPVVGSAGLIVLSGVLPRVGLLFAEAAPAAPGGAKPS